MENIYNPGHFLASEPINIKEYFKKYKRSLNEEKIYKSKLSSNKSADNDEKKSTYSNFSEAFGVAGMKWTVKEKQYLSECCDIKNLDVDGEEEPLDIKGLTFYKVMTHFKPYDATSAKLKTIQNINSRTMSFRSKFKHTATFDFELSCPSNSEVIDLQPGEDILIHVSVYVPFKYNYGELFKKRSLIFFKGVALLGSNTLANFRDMINCSSDIAVCKEVSEKPDFDLEYPSAKELYPSGFFFIDGVFYNDFRNSNAIDYSEIIRKWAAEKNIGNFTTAEMDKTRIDSLTPRMGYPYLYQHKGCCEHIFIFTHMHLLNSSDCLSSSQYPYYNGIGKLRDRYCIICGVNSARWLVVDCDRLPQSNAALCTHCFKSYHYIGDKKIGSFKAYPYYYNTAVL